MKILIVCQYFHPEQFRVNDICFQLAEMGHNVTVLTGLPNYPSGTIKKEYQWFRKRREQIRGVDVIRSSLFGRGKNKFKLILNYASFAFSATIKSLFIPKDFDVIMVYQLSPVTMALPGILTKKLSKIPLIIYCHDLWPESAATVGISKKSILFRILFGLSKWIYKSADKIVTSSKMFESYFRDVLKIEKEITHLPVYAESIFEQIDARDKEDEDVVNLVFAGNIGKFQSVETIIYAANELRDENKIIFHIVGDGSSREECEKLSRELGLQNVIFHGHHPLEDMPKFYRMADAFLVTLTANPFISYTLPNKVQSYMAAGKPILGAIDGETRHVIETAECGLCTMAEDYQGLARIIKQFLSSPQKHKEYGQNARAYYLSNYSKDQYMKSLLSIIKNAKSGDVDYV